MELTSMSECYDNVERPRHYNRGDIECIVAIKSATTGLDGFTAYCVGNAIKYLWRAEFKNGIEDYRKAKKYIDMLLELKRNSATSNNKNDLEKGCSIDWSGVIMTEK